MSANGYRRVVVTGVGAVTPLGNDVETTWQRLVAGESGAGPISAFDAGEYPVRFACEVKEFDPTRWIEKRKARKMDRFAQLVTAAARMAVDDSRLEVEPEGDRIGAAVASGQGGLGTLQDLYSTLLERGVDRVSPLAIPALLPNLGAGWVSMELGARGPLLSECTACAASTMAIGDALDAIRLGRADAMIAGGSEAAVTELGIAGFAAMRALSRRNDEPARASRPFDARRDGFVLGEAGACLVLEELEHARGRGARVYAEIAGYGTTSDAHHVSEPEPSGRQQARAIELALADAGVAADAVDYVNAHATSTPLGDAGETRVLKLALGEEHARRIAISSTKGATGHCLGAAGALEAIFTTLAVARDLVPPTINYEEPDPDCDLDYVPNEARHLAIDVALSNGFGFGGHNACLVFRKFGSAPRE
jgi:3-oxoacyl-[acyl-carrier-protein] synthase II